MRHRFIALPLVALSSLALASVALAGGWAQVTVKNAPVDPPAGEATTIEMGVLQGVTPVSWPDLKVVATEATSGAVLRAEAQAKGPAGSYVATIVFPRAGEWNLTFDSTELEMGGSVALNVAPPVAGTQLGIGAPAAPAFEVMPMVLVLFAAVVALAIAGLLLEVDRLWDALTAGGGEPGPCGWLKDRFGASWQVVPRRLNELVADPDTDRTRRAMEAMLKMGKIEVAELERAADAA